MSTNSFSRRSFLALSAMLPFSLRAFAATSIPVGLELYSVRNALKDDLMGTVRTVGADGIPVRRILRAIFRLDRSQTKEMKKLLDDLGVRCYSTHNSQSYFTPENLKTCARHEPDSRNQVRGHVEFAAQARSGRMEGSCRQLNSAADQLQPDGLKTGYHNHQLEFTPVDGKRPIEILAKNTKPSVMLQFDIGTCLEAGSDPVAWIRANPGRIRSIHCKDWAPTGKGYDGFVRRRRGGLEKHLRRRRKRWRNRVLPDRTGRQQILRIRYREKMSGEFSQNTPVTQVEDAPEPGTRDQGRFR